MTVNITGLVIGKEITSIGAENFDSGSSLQRVYYEGTAAEWSQISIGSSNGKLQSVIVYYYSETKPTTSGKFWHYTADGQVAVW